MRQYLSISAACILFISLSVITYIIHCLYFSPLNRIPGPLLRRLTSIPLLYTSYIGNEATCVAQLHRRYGPVVLIGPNDVDIADSDAIQSIYVEKGGLLKVENYRNYDIDGHQSIFSTLDPVYRSKRAKALVPLFAATRIKQHCENGGVIAHCIDDFVSALLQAKSSGRKVVDILDLSRRLANDVVTGYLFGQRYSTYTEIKAKTESRNEGLSANPFVEAFVAVGRWYLLPPWMFDLVLLYLARFAPDKDAIRSESLVNDFVSQLVEDTRASDTADSADTYQKRLLDAGISPSETIAQCKDLIFAGTDSTSTTISTICWHLARQSHTVMRLFEELTSPSGKIGKTPYLHATIREGLRMGLANPSRLPRVVSKHEGWTFKKYTFPPSTRVGCSSYVLHFDEDNFPDPFAFRPERWLTEEEDPTSGRGVSDLARQKAAWFAFGSGTRQCVARTLATEEVTLAIKKVIESQVLEGSHKVGKKIELFEWFNSKIVGGKVEIGFG